MGQLHSWHWADFSNNITRVDLSEFNFVSSQKNLSISHFLTGSCSCSEEIVQYLESKPPFSNSKISEQVLLVDTNKNHSFAQRLKAKNYSVQFINREKLESGMKEALLGVPLLLINNSNKKVLYIGGYDNNTITPLTKINLQPIINNALKNKFSQSKPIKGCIVSKEYQKLMDP
ncbi:MAG: hypothetical protein HRT44_08065, partial [Bdellovibrionales bacterium]|nr:hypothetical protein [Bdellovibrionales bacterium]NQZ19193.1 hypothetical protein [Bdellovibrionales bacterium]